MKISRLELAAFARHNSTAVDLPPHGVVLVTGANGSGKSSITEAIACAIWDETLRGEPGWRIGAPGGVEVTLDDGDFVRRNVKMSGSKKLSWQLSNDGSGAYPTTSKSQAALEERLGTFATWRNTSAFTIDAPKFAAVPDATRKVILEELLNLGRFDTAYKRARQDLNDAKAEASRISSELAVLRERASGLRSQISQARNATDELGTREDLEALRKEAVAAREHAHTCDERHAVAEESERSARKVSAEASARMSEVQRKLDDFAAIGPECPRCRQAVDHEHAEDVRDELLDALGIAKARAAEAVEAVRLAALERVKTDASRSLAHDRLRDAVVRGQALKADVERREQWEARLGELEGQLAAVEEEVGKKASALASKEADVAELEACCTVLGLQGARAGVLAHSLTVLEHSANAWLARLGMPDIAVRLSSQTQSKSGNVSDKISFEVEGAGGGRGYKAASSGERRRIDLAVQLGLSELPRERSGLDLLVFDEALDALDVEGTEAAVQVLEELSRDRCVMVISHSRDLVDRLPDSVHLHVDGGVVQRLRG